MDIKEKFHFFLRNTRKDDWDGPIDTRIRQNKTERRLFSLLNVVFGLVLTNGKFVQKGKALHERYLMPPFKSKHVSVMI